MRTRGSRVYDRPDVYKIPMVSMLLKKLTKLGMKEPRGTVPRNGHDTNV